MKKVIQSVARGFRSSRPWIGGEEYARTMTAAKGTAGYYACLVWENTVNDTADALRRDCGPKFDRNAFVKACGVQEYTCAGCYERVNVSADVSPCKCGGAKP
jgi:hypothetical protein